MLCVLNVVCRSKSVSGKTSSNGGKEEKKVEKEKSKSNLSRSSGPNREKSDSRGSGGTGLSLTSVSSSNKMKATGASGKDQYNEQTGEGCWDKSIQSYLQSGAFY